MEPQYPSIKKRWIFNRILFPHYLWRDTHLIIGEKSEAITWYDKALRIDPRDKETIESRNYTDNAMENKKRLASF
jgi:hypothetical protein